MKFEIHSAYNNMTEKGQITSRLRGVLLDLGCAGELTLWDDKVAQKFCTTCDPEDRKTVLLSGVSRDKCFSKGLYPVVELDDNEFKTAVSPSTKPAKDSPTRVTDMLGDLEVFEIKAKTGNANWLKKVLPPNPMPKITSGTVTPETLESLF